MLPDTEIRRLEKQFAAIDIVGSGLVDIQKVSEYFDADAVDWDLDGDGFIDLHEFKHIFCPDNYRLPETLDFGRDAFGELLEYHRDSLRGYRQKVEHRLTSSNAEINGLEVEVSERMKELPVVDEKTWNQWICTFGGLDKDKNGHVDARELVHSGVADEVAAYIVNMIESENVDYFTEEDFLSAMAAAHGVRPAVIRDGIEHVLISSR